MGSISVDDIHHHSHPKNESVDILSYGQVDDDGFRSSKFVGLALDHTAAPTGMREDILLLSWLIVLLRTQETNQISFDWAYKVQSNGFEHKPVIKRLSMDEVMTGIQSSVSQSAAAISRHMTAVASNQHTAMSGPVSLLLSTNYLSQTPEEAKDEVSK